MSDPNTNTINLDKIANIAHVGVRRAAVFMGLGLNAAARPDFNDYELHKLPTAPGQTAPPIDLIESGLPPERVAEFKSAFATWVTACGMRELMEHYALMLDHLNKAALLIWQDAGKLGTIDPVKATKEFTLRLGTKDKLSTLRERFDIAIQHESSVGQLHDARNCLTHDLGIIKPNRCGLDGNMVLTWRAMVLSAKDDEEQITPISAYGHRIEKASRIMLQWNDRERRFPAGSTLVLSQQDLGEICLFFAHFVIPGTVQAFMKFVHAHGLTVVPPVTAGTTEEDASADDRPT